MQLAQPALGVETVGRFEFGLGSNVDVDRFVFGAKIFDQQRARSSRDIKSKWFRANFSGRQIDRCDLSVDFDGDGVRFEILIVLIDRSKIQTAVGSSGDLDAVNASDLGQLLN